MWEIALSIGLVLRTGGLSPVFHIMRLALRYTIFWKSLVKSEQSCVMLLWWLTGQPPSIMLMSLNSRLQGRAYSLSDGVRLETVLAVSLATS